MVIPFLLGFRLEAPAFKLVEIAAGNVKTALSASRRFTCPRKASMRDKGQRRFVQRATVNADMPSQFRTESVLAVKNRRQPPRTLEQFRQTKSGELRGRKNRANFEPEGLENGRAMWLSSR
jgi:hypothetical protein